MSVDWYPGIRDFCTHWSHAPMLQQTFATMESEFDNDSDACIDAAKGLVECACRVVLSNLDDPARPHTPSATNPSFSEWLTAAVRVLELSEVRDNSFKKLVSQYHKLTATLGELRNNAGTVSHGKDGFIRKLAVHHRRSAVLAADAIITYLHEAYLEQEPDPVLTLEPYDRFSDSNSLIESHCGLEAQSDEEGGLLITVRLPNKEEIELAVSPSMLLFGVDREAYKSAQSICREANDASPSNLEEETA